MKKVYFRFGVVLLMAAAMVLAAPCVSAEDIVAPSEESSEVQTVEEPKLDDSFTVVSELDFGRATELGRSYTKQLDIVNNTASDVVVNTVIRKYEGAGEESTQLWGWLVFVGGQTNYAIAAGQTRSIGIRVVVPEDAKAGSQYAEIVLSDADGNTRVVSVKIDVAGDDLKYASEAVDAWIEPFRLAEDLNGHVTVKNTGTAGFTSVYQVKVKNFFGGDWSVVAEESKEVYPNGQVSFEAKNNIGYGVFSVEQRVTYVDNEGRMKESLVSRTIINLPWWAIAIAGGVLLFIIILIIVLKHHGKSDKEAKKLERAEKKARKASIERIEKAETKTIVEEKSAQAEEKKAESSEKPVTSYSEIVNVNVEKPTAAPQPKVATPGAPVKKKPVKKIIM